MQSSSSTTTTSIINTSTKSPLRILTLGDGNLSYSYSLIQQANLSSNAIKKLQRAAAAAVTNNNTTTAPTAAAVILPQPIELIATVFDSESELYSKYPESVSIVKKLRSAPGPAVNIQFNVDATNLINTLKLPTNTTNTATNPIEFDRIIFNHPHSGQEDLQLHIALLKHIFHSINPYCKLNSTELIITLANSQPENWELLSTAINNGFQLKSRSEFNSSNYLGYECKRHHSARNFSLKVQKMEEFKFIKINERNINSNTINITELQCLICNRRFPTISELLIHSTGIKPINSTDISIECMDCGRGFPSERALQQHQLSMNNRPATATEHIRIDKELLINNNNNNSKRKNSNSNTNANTINPSIAPALSTVGNNNISRLRMKKHRQKILNQLKQNSNIDSNIANESVSISSSISNNDNID